MAESTATRDTSDSTSIRALAWWRECQSIPHITDVPVSSNSSLFRLKWALFRRKTGTSFSSVLPVYVTGIFFNLCVNVWKRGNAYDTLSQK